ncbi:hypothetical protein SUGI_1005350 [Cryptomeria japonica]|uniref:calcium-binding protein CBP n=1 Tax=Cryptomeria japonica TaxID=3369 RepID=UPI0024149EA6|nr:calcium-binding protein CBP [Cryptomeria japonica]GLJ47609.1 hypothetical protein SUGI_1005350 [Cryptomeria japonica]
MSGYPHNPYGAAPPNNYGGPPPPNQYGGPPPPNQHGAPPPNQYGAPPPNPYGGSAPPPSGQYGQTPYGQGTPYQTQSYPTAPPYGNPTAPTYGYPPTQQQPLFAPGTDPEIIRAFQAYDQDGSGFIDDKELQKALSTAAQSYSIRTVHLLMFNYNSNSTRIGPKEFTALWHDLQAWRSIFETFDRDRSGKIDTMELRDALLRLGYSVSPPVLQLLLTKYDRTGQGRGIDYDSFIECAVIVKGLTEKFKEKDKKYTGTATLTYEEFMLTVLPFIVA